MRRDLSEYVPRQFSIEKAILEELFNVKKKNLLHLERLLLPKKLEKCENK